MVTALIDGDVCVYKCCFSVKDDDFDQTVTKVDELVSNITTFCGAENARIFLTGPGNFREEIPSEDVYKGNRDKSKRPTHYQAIRDYLVEKHKAEVICGYEADDALGVNQTENTVIATVDKDLQQIPGKHLNFYRSPDLWELKDVTEEEAAKFFWVQVLCGDLQDNVKGIKGIGKVKAAKLLEGLNVSEYKEAVVNKYLEVYGDQGLIEFDKTARLVFIKRESLTSEYFNYY